MKLKGINLSFLFSSGFWACFSFISFCLIIAFPSTLFIYLFVFSLIIVFASGVLNMINPKIEKNDIEKKSRIKSKIIIINLITLVVAFLPVYYCSNQFYKINDPSLAGIEGGLMMVVPFMITILSIVVIYIIKEVIIHFLKKRYSKNI
jgi:hypothetical protein|tara:strand:+ start:779 stop:1222 length:444 start_codon:yes stop_codon:yes gene_type:complete